MRVLAFAASSSRESINKKLVTYAAGLRDDWQVEIIDLNDYELPLFSVDREAELGELPLAHKFLDCIAAADALIIGFAEHNGSYSAWFKNLFDWCSRITMKVYQGKPVIMLATSPGARGGASVLSLATQSAVHFGAELKGSLSVPKFSEHFDSDSGELTNLEFKTQLQDLVNAL